MRNILITGGAGFIGYHLCKHPFVQNNFDNIVLLDNLNHYYDVKLKWDRLNNLGFEKISFKESNSPFKKRKFIFYYNDLVQKEILNEIFMKYQFEVVVHLAAQAGVRYSIENPDAYTNSNLVGFMNVLECCRNYPVKHFIYASSSSVYGANTKIPFSENDIVDTPVSLYAATKKANELFAYSYSVLYGIPSTGLRFFTVYGPWGRPDMAYFSFAQKIMKREKITVFNHGKMKRDFTYIDDITESISRLINNPPIKTENVPSYRILNIGHGSPVGLLDFIETLETYLEKKVDKVFFPMQQGDVVETWADTDALKQITGYEPLVELDTGIKSFTEWFLNRYF